MVIRLFSVARRKINMTKLYNFIEIFKEPVISENGESINIKK